MPISLSAENVSGRTEDFMVEAVTDEVFAGKDPGVLVIPGYPVQGWPIILYGQDRVKLRHVPTGQIATITGYSSPTGGHFDQGDTHLSIGPTGSHSWKSVSIIGFLRPEEIRG